MCEELGTRLKIQLKKCKKGYTRVAVSLQKLNLSSILALVHRNLKKLDSIKYHME
jgi:hypothetical protein